MDRLRNGFKGYLGIDVAPNNSICEWCGKPATQYYLVSGGIYHNTGVILCQLCGEKFAHYVEEMSRETRIMADQNPYNSALPVHDKILSKQDGQKTADASEEHEEEIVTWEEYLRWLRERWLPPENK